MTTDLADLLSRPDGPAGRTDVWKTVAAAEALLTDRMGAQVELADPEDPVSYTHLTLPTTPYV